MNIYSKIEVAFERISEYALKIFGNALTFIVAVLFVLFWLGSADYESSSAHDILRDFLLAITFITFFIMQKSFNRYNAALHIKLNELVSAHDKASNKIVNIEEKSEAELKELQEEYIKISKEHSENSIDNNPKK